MANIICKDCNEKDKIYLFKVRDYTTKLVGRKNEKGGFYYIQRGDGFIAKYDVDRVVDSIELQAAEYEPKQTLQDTLSIFDNVFSKEDKEIVTIFLKKKGLIQEGFEDFIISIKGKEINLAEIILEFISMKEDSKRINRMSNAIDREDSVKDNN